MSIQSVITNIVSGATKLWHEVVTDIEADAAKVRAALPSSALPNFDAAVSVIKQGASDAISLADSAFAGSAGRIAPAIEAALDAELVALTNGAALPLVPLVNDGVDKLDAFAVSVAHAWALKAKAALAPGS